MITKQSTQQSSASQKLARAPLQIQVKINRPKSQKAVLESKLNTASQSHRKARTRSLIQLLC